MRHILQYFSPAPQSYPRTRPDVIHGVHGEQNFVDSMSGGRSWKEYGWEHWALPLGNGWFGAKIFGGVPVERIQITENSLANPWPGGLKNFCEFFVEMWHDSPATAYRRDLDLDDAVAHVDYSADDRRFHREFFASYPDRCAALRLTAGDDKGLFGRLFAVVPFCRDYDATPGDGLGRTGKVEYLPEKVLLSGRLESYGIDYEAQLRWQSEGGICEATADGIVFRGVQAITFFFSCATNYRLEERVFLEPVPSQKLSPYPHPHAIVEETLDRVMARGFEELRARHLADYRALFGRVEVSFGGEYSEALATDKLLEEHRSGHSSRYLEELYFQYGRYLLICSSRPGTLPCNLQGIWTVYDHTPWSGGYWHNINVQMNYWPAFSTGLPELFESYADYHRAYLPAARRNAAQDLAALYPGKSFSAPGWSIGTGGWPYHIESCMKGGGGGGDCHSGPGTVGLTSKLFWDWYDFTRDPAVLRRAYPTLRGAAEYLLNCLHPQEDGTWLIEPSASPEQEDYRVTYEIPKGGWRDHPYIVTKGCAFDQQMAYETFRDALRAADALGEPDDDFLKKLREVLPHLDPVLIGDSGQVKEYREEHQYGELGEYHHRHLSQLIGLVPGSIINERTPGWMAAARVSLTERGDESTGWAMAHRLNAWARLQDGPHAYKLLSCLLAKGTLPNLWDTHPPFQIDGNLGGTAGIAEMLLQSHAGVIHLLPALPPEWKDGAFRGLRARGGFTICAQWRAATLVSLTIHADVDGEANLIGRGLPTQDIFLKAGETRKLL